MTPRRSLRAQVLVGAALWTIGLFIMASLALTGTMVSHPTVPITVHRALSHVSVALAIAIGCMVAGVWSVRRGLASIGQLRSRLSAIHRNQEHRVEGAYPSEVQPLVDDLNGLLDYREQIVRRAIAKAGDLAHGLKTPLAVLSQEAERAAEAGQAELAARVGQQVERMRRQIDYHLAHARAAGSGAASGARAAVASSVDGIARTLERLYADRGLTFEVRVDANHVVRGQREDLDEMLGNLMDNACKWARSRVAVSSRLDAAQVAIEVDDDGPGLDAAMLDAVMRRGVRADEAVPGSGLGLAIVRDLAEVYGGSVALGRSRLGGLNARLLLPASAAAQD
jgi:signal transduction histidine kinase